ncbi:hypothetical protein A9G17_00295 [Gilliamella sp. wkB7]|uniref:hypothetical protein n=1 Tax=Gilliamella sp. wkB7 TaxID=3120264 RepID=UPI000810C063|nr:hypothetical protein [Gilliamella apicola]OCF91665.1 hypothetical protein A9G17_00295 [Gilliamella apicola]
MKIIITIKLFFVVSILVFIITSLMGYFNKAFMPEFVSYLKLISLIIIFFCLFGFIFLRLFHDKWLLKKMVKPKVIKTVQNNEKSYEYLNYRMNQGVALIWESDAIFANFNLPGNSKNFSGYIKQLSLKEDGNFYLSVANGHKIEQIAFNELTSTIQITINATHYSFKSLCNEVLKLELNIIFKFADHVRKQLSLNEKYIFTFDPPTKVFLPINNNKELFEIEKYYIFHNNDKAILMKRVSKQKRILAPIENIKSKIEFENGEKIDIKKWLDHLCDIIDIN